MQEKNPSLRQQLTKMNLVLVIATALLAFAGTMFLTLRMEFQAINTNLTNSALVLSQLPQVRRVLTGETDADWLTAYLDETISAVDGIDLIMVADTEATLIYTPEKEHIGHTYTGSAWKDTLQGEARLWALWRWGSIPAASGPWWATPCCSFWWWRRWPASWASCCPGG